MALVLMVGLVGLAAPGAALASPGVGTISTVAGDPVASGPATSFGQQPEAVAAGLGGAVYVADAANTVRKLSATGVETTVAGNGSGAYAGDGGPATGAELQFPLGVAVDGDGSLLIADSERVRLVAASSCSSACPFGLASMTKGYIYTIAGDDTYGYSGDGGPATSTQVDPGGVAVDGVGDLLIADSYGNRVRLVARSSCSSGCPFGLASMTGGDIYTVAGSGAGGFTGAWFSGDGGPATRAQLNDPDGVVVDGDGNLLIADAGNLRVRLVAGSSCSSGCPYGLSSTTAGDIYTIAGDGTPGYSGDGGPATSAELDDLDAVAVDGGGDVVIANGARARLVAASSCSTACPFGLSSMIAGDIYAIAGDGTTGYSGDGGPATSAELHNPAGLAVDGAGDLLLADTGNARVRLVAGSSCSAGCPYGLASMTRGDIYTIAGNGTFRYSGDGGPATSAELNSPDGLAVDGGGDLLIDDQFNNRVRLVAGSSCASGCRYGLASLTRGDIYTIAGNGTVGYSGDGGPATSAELDPGGDMAVDGGGDLLIAGRPDDRVRLVAGSSCSSGCPFGLVSMTRGDIYTVAGDGVGGDGGDDGPATSAELSYPASVAVDVGGDLLIADAANERVRLVAGSSCSSACPYGLVSMTKGYIYTIAGTGTSGYSGDGGPATSARLYDPQSVAVDGRGDVLINDFGNERVRLVAGSACSSGCPYGLVSMTRGYIYMIADNGANGYSGDGGPATSAELHNATGLTVDTAGDLLIADVGNDRVRLVAGSSCLTACPFGLSSMTEGDIYTVAGNGTRGYAGDGAAATSAELNTPSAVTVDGSGDLLIADSGNWRVREVAAQTATLLSVSVTGLGSGTVTGGGLTCELGTCSEGLAAGAVVTFTATPAVGSIFSGWSGGGCSGTGSCQVTVASATMVTATFSSAYAVLVEATPGLVGYWPLVDRSGTIATDELGEHDGDYFGGVTFGVPGPIFGSLATAVGLDGINGQVQLPALGSFSNWTVEGWADLAVGASGDNCLYCGRNGVRLIALPSGFYADDVTTGTKLGAILQEHGASNVGGWVYWALVRSGQTLTLFRDGLQVASSSLGGEGASVLDGAVGTYGGRYFLHGDVGQVAAYGVALTSAAIEQRYEAGVGGPAESSIYGTG
jgi:hypothetical protein